MSEKGYGCFKKVKNTSTSEDEQEILGRVCRGKNTRDGVLSTNKRGHNGEWNLHGT